MLKVSVQAACTARQHHRQVLRQAAGHHRVDRHLLDRALDQVGRHDRDHFVLVAARAGEHAQHRARASAAPPAARRSSPASSRPRPGPRRRRARCVAIAARRAGSAGAAAPPFPARWCAIHNPASAPAGRRRDRRCRSRRATPRGSSRRCASAPRRARSDRASARPRRRAATRSRARGRRSGPHLPGTRAGPG